MCGLLVRKAIFLQCSYLITTRSCSYSTQFSPYVSLALLPTVSYRIDQMSGVPDIFFFLHRVLGYITQTDKPSVSSSKTLGLQTCRTTAVPGTFEISFSIFQPDILALVSLLFTLDKQKPFIAENYTSSLLLPTPILRSSMNTVLILTIPHVLFPTVISSP